MSQLAKGANAPLTDGAPVVAELHCSGAPVDLSALLLDAAGKVRSDADMVFFNQPEAEEGAVRHTPKGGAALPERVVVETAALPADVDRVVLVGSCDPEDESRTFAEVGALTLRAAHGAGESVEFAVPPLTAGERAAVLVELYRRGGGWKIRAVGQGYASGLAGVATDFGISVDEEPTPAPTPPVPAPVAAPPVAEPVAAPPPPLAPPVPAPAPLGAVSLDKGGRVAIGLDKGDADLVVTARLQWDGGSAQRVVRGADLDFYALFVPASDVLPGPLEPGALVRKDHVPQGAPPPAEAIKKRGRYRRPSDEGSKDAVYYKNLGSLKEAPFISLDGDARTPGKETIKITRPAEQGYVLFCAYSALSNGAGSFLSFGAHVVVSDGHGSEVTVPLFEKTRTRYWVAIALADFTVPEGVAIRQIEAYSARMTEKRPLLHRDGTIAMNAGPVEFKHRT
ncbi:TerD family protein [Streptomyces radicis]|uniref:Tellurium resistance protein n=1 Tax=Streptomyces radicis TaxID=1750517 RepID=A0A3A9W5A4_9ACTN|nr:TerD family protein [Streptomyces radicis]RKN08415.1 Tellurium resistance protein [Streptomyces radicis]RKN21550.1 Tellurium resistance protein [Streptomyces radicis]